MCLRLFMSRVKVKFPVELGNQRLLTKNSKLRTGLDSLSVWQVPAGQ